MRRQELPSGTSCTASIPGQPGCDLGQGSDSSGARLSSFEELMNEPCDPSLKDRKFLTSGIAGGAVPPLEQYFREAGSGTAVVCIHSSASTSGQWRPLMEYLADRFRVIAVDLYGSGKTAAWPH